MNTLKEGGKDYFKADTKTTGFFGSDAKGDRGGFGKDYGEIKTNRPTTKVVGRR